MLCDGYMKLFIGLVGIELVVVSGFDIDVFEEVEWELMIGIIDVDEMWFVFWVLFVVIVVFGVLFFVGWGILVVVVVVIVVIMLLWWFVESRVIVCWVLVFGLCVIVYSLGWLVWVGM